MNMYCTDCNDKPYYAGATAPDLCATYCCTFCRKVVPFTVQTREDNNLDRAIPTIEAVASINNLIAMPRWDDDVGGFERLDTCCSSPGIGLYVFALLARFRKKMVQEKTYYRDGLAFIVLTACVVTVMYSTAVPHFFSGWPSQYGAMESTTQRPSIVRKLAQSSLLNKSEDHLMSSPGKRVLSKVIIEETEAQNVTSLEINNVTTAHNGYRGAFKEIDYTALKCPKERAVPGRNLPKIALASFPRSGNGWARHLIQYATGLYVGSYGWISMKGRHPNMEVFRATGKDVQNGRVVIIKTHGHPLAELANEAVLLIRNPYKSIVSDIYHRIFVRKKFTKNDMIRFFETEQWKKEAYARASAWKNFALQWIDQSKRLLVIQNEKLFQNTEKELARIIDFLHQPLDIKRLRCAVKVYYPTTFGARFSRDPYTDDIRNVLDSCIKEVNETLVRCGHEPLPTYQRILSY